jgi:hypothetical protein
MKKTLCVASLSLMALSVPALAANVGVSVSVGEPGFFGQINIGNAPPPVLINPRPVVIQPPAVGVVAEPIYLHVPPGHEKHWSKHCREYNACGRPVYFVQNDWYDRVYVPHYQHEHGDRSHREDRDDHHDNHRDDHRDEHHDRGHHDD